MPAGLRAAPRSRPRVAVLFAGQLRTMPILELFYRRSLTSLRAAADVDIFFHAWQGPQPHSIEAISAVTRLQPVESSLEDVFRRTGSLPWLGTEPAGDADAIAASFEPMWKSLAAGFELIVRTEAKLGAEYDWIIRTRPDVAWDLPGEFARAVIGGRSRLARRIAAHRSAHDVAAVLRREDANTYFSTGKNVKETLHSYYLNHYRTFVSEFAFNLQLDRLGMAWDSFVSDVHIVRLSGDHFKIRQDPDFFALGATRAPFIPEWTDGAEGLSDVSRTALLASSLASAGVCSPRSEKLAEMINAKRIPGYGDRMVPNVGNTMRWGDKLERVALLGEFAYSARPLRFNATGVISDPKALFWILCTAVSVYGSRFARDLYLRFWKYR